MTNLKPCPVSVCSSGIASKLISKCPNRAPDPAVKRLVEAAEVVTQHAFKTLDEYGHKIVAIETEQLDELMSALAEVKKELK